VDRAARGLPARAALDVVAEGGTAGGVAEMQDGHQDDQLELAEDGEGRHRAYNVDKAPRVSSRSGPVSRRRLAIDGSCRVIDVCLAESYDMPVGVEAKRRGRYTRRSFVVDERALRRARKVLNADTDAHAVRLAVERVLDMDAFWQVMVKSRGRLSPGSFDLP
jgi:hypothetical protein